MAGQKPNWFIAFPIPAEKWFPVNGTPSPASIRMFHPHDLHITVAFLGPVSRKKALNAWSQVEKLSLQSVPISFNQLKPFGSFSTPSAYGLTLDDGREELREIIEQYQEPLLAPAGKKPGSRRIVPHITLARPKRRLSRKDVYDIAEWRRDFKVPSAEITVNEIALYTWADATADHRFETVRKASFCELGGKGSATSPKRATSRFLFRKNGKR